jgi:hypothetical protein
VGCFVHSLRFLHSSLLSVPNRKAPPDMLRAFQFVGHRNGVILNRNIAMAGGVRPWLQGRLSDALNDPSKPF